MGNHYQGTYSYKTDMGKVRQNNEDQALVLLSGDGDVLLIVCDGMGGAQKGEVASKIAVDTFAEAFLHKKKHHFAYGDKHWLKKTAREANRRIFEYADAHPQSVGMGTTLCAALISDERLLLANVGDSRAYALDANGVLKQLTVDQTYVNFLVETGKIAKDEASSHPDRHVLMNALGIYPSLSLDISEEFYAGESVMLCSDGLYNLVDFEQIANLLGTDERCDQKVSSLIAEANASGGNDNIGVALWESVEHD